MGVYNLGSGRMVCWDDFLIDQNVNTEIIMHKPEKREKVFECDASWEGNNCGYMSVVKCLDEYRLYYRVCNIVYHANGESTYDAQGICLAVSKDGIHFKRAGINKYISDGITKNNIILNQGRDNFSVIYDENPACPPDERFKALSMGGGDGINKTVDGETGLYLFVSENGIDFRLKRRLPIPGSFDSYNLVVWDNTTKQYFIYTRGEHTIGDGEAEFDVVKKARSIFREIRVTTTKDFESFEYHGELDYGKDNIPLQLYTNQVHRYRRADDMFIGFPARYIDRWEDAENFEQMPLAERHAYLTKFWGREGTAISDCAIMTSRDGIRFNKWDEAYLTPGIEEIDNWWYGNCYMVYGLHEIPSQTEGAPDELCFYMPDKYRIKSVEVYRYTTRLDGFFSWYAKYRGGEILTKPFIFAGDELEVNFASSALGDMVITVCDSDGNGLEGYKSIKLFGDSVKRKVGFAKALSELAGKPVRLRIALRDCHLYSFKFN
ncbi:MAG: hypothetical protein J6V93_04310 [Clostridia bacterium]|nr:hypothetical protein [Clostridia bacterium]